MCLLVLGFAMAFANSCVLNTSSEPKTLKQAVAVENHGGKDEMLSVHCENIISEWKKEKYRKELPAEFESLKKEVAETETWFRGNGIPESVRDRVAKRFEIVHNLDGFISGCLKKTDIDSLMFAVRGTRDMKTFAKYFRDEKEYAEKLGKQSAAKKFSIKDFGAAGDGITDDSDAFQAALDKLEKLNGETAELFIPQGKYLLKKLISRKTVRNVFDPKSAPFEHVSKGFFNLADAHLLIANLENVTIKGETPETTLLFGNKGQGILMAGCNNVTIKDLSLKFTKKTHTQGTVKNFNYDGKYVTVKIDEGYPIPGDDSWKDVKVSCAQAYNENGILSREGSDLYWSDKYEDLGGNTYKMYFTRSRYKNVRSGLRIAFPIRVGCVDGVTITRSRFCTLDGVTLYNSSASGFPAQETYVTSYINVRLIPEKGSLMSSAADGSYSGQNFFGLYLKDCDFQNYGDDGLNIFGAGSIMAEKKGNVFVATGHGLYDWRVVPNTGEKIKLKNDQYAYVVDDTTGQIKAEGRIISVRADQDFTAFELDQELGEDIRTVRDYDGAKTLLELLRNRSKNSADWSPDIIFFQESGIGTVVSGCRFGNNRHNCLTIGAANSMIENCELSNCTDYGILLNSYVRGWKSWLEGPPPYNVIIRNNVLKNNVFGISTQYSIHDGLESKVCPIRNITITGNTISNCTFGVWLRNVSGLHMKDNVFSNNDRYRIGTAANCVSENDLCNGLPLSSASFENPSETAGKIDFKITDPAKGEQLHDNKKILKGKTL